MLSSLLRWSRPLYISHKIIILLHLLVRTFSKFCLGVRIQCITIPFVISLTSCSEEESGVFGLLTDHNNVNQARSLIKTTLLNVRNSRRRGSCVFSGEDMCILRVEKTQYGLLKGDLFRSSSRGYVSYIIYPEVMTRSP